MCSVAEDGAALPVSPALLSQPSWLLGRVCATLTTQSGTTKAVTVCVSPWGTLRAGWDSFKASRLYLYKGLFDFLYEWFWRIKLFLEHAFQADWVAISRDHTCSLLLAPLSCSTPAWKLWQGVGLPAPVFHFAASTTALLWSWFGVFGCDHNNTLWEARQATCRHEFFCCWEAPALFWQSK